MLILRIRNKAVKYPCVYVCLKTVDRTSRNSKTEVVRKHERQGLQKKSDFVATRSARQ